MNREASELLKIAKALLSTDFPSKEALDKYLKDHPNADRSNHRVMNRRSINRLRMLKFDEAKEQEEKDSHKSIHTLNKEFSQEMMGFNFYKFPISKEWLKEAQKSKLRQHMRRLLQADGVADKTAVNVAAGLSRTEIRATLRLKNIAKKSVAVKTLVKSVNAADAYCVKGLYKDINNILRNGVLPKEYSKEHVSLVKTTVSSLHDLFDIVPDEKKNSSDKLYRGFAVGKDVVETIKKGMVFSDSAFMSTSPDRNVAIGFVKTVGARISPEKRKEEQTLVLMTLNNVKRRGIKIAKIASEDVLGKSKWEVLLPDHCRVKIDDIKHRTVEGRDVMDVYGTLLGGQSKAASEIVSSNNEEFYLFDTEIDKKNQEIRMSEPIMLKTQESKNACCVTRELLQIARSIV